MLGNRKEIESLVNKKPGISLFCTEGFALFGKGNISSYNSCGCSSKLWLTFRSSLGSGGHDESGDPGACHLQWKQGLSNPTVVRTGHLDRLTGYLGSSREAHKSPEWSITGDR